MNTVRTLGIAMALTLALGTGIALGAGIIADSETSAEQAISQALGHLQRASQAGLGDVVGERRRARAAAYLVLAQTELQARPRVAPLN